MERNNDDLEITDSDELKEQRLGPIGSSKRNQYELEFLMEVTKDDIEGFNYLELKDELLGKIGTPERDKFELELKIERHKRFYLNLPRKKKKAYKKIIQGRIDYGIY